MLVTTGTSSVVVTYRLTSALGPEYNAEDDSAPIDVEVVTADGTVTTSTLSVPDDAYIEVAEYTWETDWRQHTVSIPPGDVHGFAIYAAYDAGCGAYCDNHFTFGFEIDTIEAL